MKYFLEKKYNLLIIFELFSFYFLCTQKNLFKFDYSTLNITYFDLFISSILIYFVTKYFIDILNKNTKLFSCKLILILFIIFNLYVSFALVGKSTFLSSHDYSIMIKSEYIFKYFLTFLFLLPISYSIYYFIKNYRLNLDEKERKIKDKAKVFAILFSIIFIIWFLISLFYYPGNLTNDSVDMWSQALGHYQISNHHPAIYTIIMRWLSFIWKNPFIIIIFNITFFSLVVSRILTFLYEKGFKLKSLIIYEVLFSLAINNVSLITIVWKDIPFTASMLWLTFEIYRLFSQKDKRYDHFYSYIPLILSLSLTRFFRINGIVPYVFVIFLLLICLIIYKKLRFLVIILSTVMLNLFIKYPLYKIYDVSKKGPDTSFSAINKIYLRGIAASVYYNFDPNYDYQDVNKILNTNLMVQYYNPYNNDTYDFSPEIINAKINYDDISSVYFKYFFKDFKSILRNQLDSTNLLWSFSTPDDGFNYTYSTGISYGYNLSKKELGIKNNRELKDGVYQIKSNFGNSIIEGYKKIGNYDTFIYSIFYRPAIFLSILLMLLIISIEKRKKLIITMIPTLSSILFWCGFLYHQSYRYLWFIFVNTLFILLVYFYENSKEKVKKP